MIFTTVFEQLIIVDQLTFRTLEDRFPAWMVVFQNSKILSWVNVISLNPFIPDP
jgi:hypothetical protein